MLTKTRLYFFEHRIVALMVFRLLDCHDSILLMMPERIQKRTIYANTYFYQKS